MKSILFILVFALLFMFLLEIPNMIVYHFRFISRQGEVYLREDLKKMKPICGEGDLISSLGTSTSPMKIDYISSSRQTPLIKYKISCNNYSYYVMVWRFSSIADSIDKYFEKPTVKPIY